MITICPKIPFKSSILTNLQRNRYKIHKCYTRKYSERNTSQSDKKSSIGVYAFGTITLIGGATLAYAKYDNEFRKYLQDNVPFTESFMKFVFQEEKTFQQRYDSANKLVTNIFTPKEKPEKSTASPSAEYQSKKFPSGLDNKEDVKKTVKSSRVENEKSPEIKIQQSAEKSEENIEKKPFHVKNIENEITNVADTALKSYAVAVTALKNFSSDISTLVNQNFEKLDAKSWHKLKVSSEQKTKFVEQANQKAKEALETVQMYKSMLEHGDIKIPEQIASSTIQIINKIEHQINSAKEHFTTELANAAVTQRFWDKVGEARKQYQEELGILCPSIKLEEPKLNLSDGEIDLFILHAQKKIEYLQKELARLETTREHELIRALDRAHDDGTITPLLEEQLRSTLEKEKRNLVETFQKKALEVQADAEREIKAQLKRQAEAHSDHLNDAIRSKELEMKRLFERQLNDEIMKAKLEYKTQLAAMVGRLKGVDSALKVRADADKNAHKAQALWSACQSLHQAIKVDEFGDKKDIKPLADEVKAISNAAIDGDELVKVVIQSIPPIALERGVYNESTLRERFPQVEKIARRLALVPIEGARLPVYFLSFIQSLLMVNAASPISKAELDDEIVDFSQLTTNDILQRAKYWVERGDFYSTLRYMNLLTGASRVVAEEWIKEVQIYLETKQAANTLMAHAAANGLVYL